MHGPARQADSRLKARRLVSTAFSPYRALSLVVVAAVGVVIWVAAFAVLGALRTRYSRRVNIAASSLLLSGLALALLALGERNGIVSPFVVDAINPCIPPARACQDSPPSSDLYAPPPTVPT